MHNKSNKSKDTNRSRRKKYNFVILKSEKLLEKNEEYKLISNWQNKRDKKSLKRLLGAYKKLTISIAKKFFSYGLQTDDLIQEGMIGLIHAIEKFDISKGFRLSTYARWWIKALMQDYVLKNWSVVKSGSTSAQKTLFFSFNKIKKQVNFSAPNFMDNEDLKKISNLLNIKTLDIQNLETRLAMGDQSLNQKIDENDESNNLISLLKDESPTQDMILQETSDGKLKKNWLSEAIKLLNDREKFIISSRKLNEKSKTLEKIGKELKISKERVRQIEVNSLKKLKKNILTISDQSKDFFIN